MTKIAITVLVVFTIGSPLSLGQRRAQPITPAGSTTDALVFGDRTWVYYLAPNSVTPHKLAKGNFPALSHDGKQAAYVTPIDATNAEPESVSIRVVDIASGKNSGIFAAKAWASHLTWSPKGDWLALTLAYLNGKRELEVISADGSTQRKIIGGGEQGASDIFSSVWAPDGKSIFFQDMENLFQVGLNGRVIAKTPLGVIVGEKESITSSDTFVPSPVDQNLLAYTRSVPGTKLFEREFGEPNTALFIYNLQTKTRKRVTALDLLALDPVWSRDGRYIYFSGYHDREGKAAYPFKIFRINPDGSGLVQIAAGENPGG